MHMTTSNMKASKVQKAGIIQALRHDSLRGSLALKYNCPCKKVRTCFCNHSIETNLSNFHSSAVASMNIDRASY